MPQKTTAIRLLRITNKQHKKKWRRRRRRNLFTTFFKFIHAKFLEKHDEWMLLKIIQMMIKRWTQNKRKQFTFKEK